MFVRDAGVSSPFCFRPQSTTQLSSDSILCTKMSFSSSDFESFSSRVVTLLLWMLRFSVSERIILWFSATSFLKSVYVTKTLSCGLQLYEIRTKNNKDNSPYVHSGQLLYAIWLYVFVHSLSFCLALKLSCSVAQNYKYIIETKESGHTRLKYGL